MTILFSHGNAEDLGMIYDWFVQLSMELNVNVFSYDYAGYGQSSRIEPTEASVFADIDAVLAYMQTELQLKPSQIILYVC